MHADLFLLREGAWLLSSAGQPQDELQLESIGCRLRVAGLYEKVEFDPAQNV